MNNLQIAISHHYKAPAKRHITAVQRNVLLLYASALEELNKNLKTGPPTTN